MKNCRLEFLSDGLRADHQSMLAKFSSVSNRIDIASVSQAIAVKNLRFDLEEKSRRFDTQLDNLTHRLQVRVSCIENLKANSKLI